MSDALHTSFLSTGTDASGEFDCCGGNDDKVKAHTMDCGEHPGELGGQHKPRVVQTVFSIPSCNLSHLSERLVKLNKRAVKLGVPEILSRVLTYTPGRWIETVDGKLWIEATYDVELTGSAPKISGWTFLGTVEHTSFGNILRAVPGLEIPEAFRNAPKVCSHCNTKRDRKDTFLVKDEAGEIKQIGHNCIRDFLGHVSPEQLGFAAQWIAELSDLTGESSGGSGRKTIDAMDFLNLVSELTLTQGYKKQETAAGALSQIINAADHRKHGTTIHPSPKALEFTLKAIEWVKTCEAVGGYLLNLKITALNALENPLAGVGPKATGLLGSLIQAYLRAVEADQIKKNTPKATSEHVGAVGDKVELKLRLKRKFSFSSAYGYRETLSYCLLFEDSAGNVFKWTTGNGNDFVETEEYVLKGTIKAHVEYKTTKQTLMTRCKTVRLKAAA